MSVAVPLASVYALRMPETRTLVPFEEKTLAETWAPATGVPYCVITCATTSKLSRIAAEAGGRLRSTCVLEGTWASSNVDLVLQPMCTSAMRSTPISHARVKHGWPRVTTAPLLGLDACAFGGERTPACM